MSVVCISCSKLYTGSNTEHILYSTKFGHVKGASCLKSGYVKMVVEEDLAVLYILIAAFYWCGFWSVEYNWDTDFGLVPFTGVSFNNFRKNIIEFCVGFENGSLKNKNKVAYFVGKCSIFSVGTDKFCAKESWLANINVRFKTENFSKDIRNEKIVSHEICGISKILKYDNERCRREVYINYPVGDFPDVTSQVIHEFSPTIISTKYYEKYLIYTFIPNAENSMLHVHLINGALKIVNKQKIDDFDWSIGVFALDKTHELLARVVKIPIVLIFHHGFKTLNFYTVI
uniref:Uncharacterized protein n=1 Tax=Strongyloides venezuelensis TaxID=75913 RepID=A0A0K0F9D7_STRVS